MIIRNTAVLTMDPDNHIFRHADVWVEGDRFKAIDQHDPKKNWEGQAIIDGRGKVLMPGLINLHSHVGMSLFRNYGNDVNLQTWLTEWIWPLEDHLNREDIQAGSALNFLEMLLSGTTSFVDMYYEMDGVGQVVEDMGMRACLTRGMTGPDEEGIRIKEQRELFETWDGKADGRIKVMIGPHAIYTNTLDSLKAQKKLGDELGCGFHIHIAETKKEVDDCYDQYGISPVELFDRLGMLDERTLAAHCVWLSEKDIEILAKRKVHCVHNPASNMKLASGFMPVKDLQEAGVNLCLGTDGASSNNKQDMFREMFLAALIHKGRYLDPLVLPARDVLQMATINGAKALGWEKDLGSIEVGKKADCILVDFDNAHHTPYPDDIEAALVYSSSGHDVLMTVVDGRVLCKDGIYLGSKSGEDEASIREKAERVWAKLKEKDV